MIVGSVLAKLRIICVLFGLLAVVYVKVPVGPACPELERVEESGDHEHDVSQKLRLGAAMKNTNSSSLQAEQRLASSLEKHKVEASLSESSETTPTADAASVTTRSPTAAGGGGSGHIEGCTWAPDKKDPYNRRRGAYDKHECTTLLLQRIRNTMPFPFSPPHRWIMIGDSTMGNLFHHKPLRKKLTTGPLMQSYCPNQLMCYNRQHSRCKVNEAYLYPPVDGKQWIPPNYTLGEGPVHYGAERGHENCQDVGGIFSEFALCQRRRYVPSKGCRLPWTRGEKNNGGRPPSRQQQKQIYGGYFAIDFARDVEFQTYKYKTTQQNFVAFMNEHYNADPWLYENFGGSPVCIISMGAHDMCIPKIKIGRFVFNFEWFLALLLIPGYRNVLPPTVHPTCSHVVLLHNTAPKKQNDTDTSELNWKNTAERSRQWNRATENMVRNSTVLPRDRITIVDAFDASRRYPHRDNIHLEDSWYESLGSFFAQVMDKLTLPPKQPSQQPKAGNS